MTELNNLPNVNLLLHFKIIRNIFKTVQNADYLTLQNLNLASLVNTILKKINSNIRKTTKMNQWQNTSAVPLDETHLVTERGLIHQDVSNKVRQPGKLNRASQLKQSGQQISSTIMPRPESILIRQD